MGVLACLGRIGGCCLARCLGVQIEVTAGLSAGRGMIIDRKDAKQYQSAVDLMVRLRRLADSAGRPDRFASLLEQVRTEHKAKRKLKALLDAQGW